MEEVKKRKLEEGTWNGETDSNNSPQAVEELRSLLDPLPKPQLVDLLARLGSQYPSIAEEIKNVARADPALRKLFVRGLAWNTSSETLCAAFEEHGEIEEGAVIFDKATGKSRGYGFVTFKDMESAQIALKAPSKMIDGRMAVCNLASEGLSSSTITPDQAQRKLYVGGLSPDTTTEMLLNFFRRHGEIEEGSVAYDKDTDKSRGYGFVTYKTVESAKKAIDDPQRILGGRNITVKLADNYKGKVNQVPAPAAMVPVPLSMTPGYLQTQKPPGSELPVGYTYPQSMAAYPNATYSSPPAAPVPYPVQPQIPYPQYAANRDPPPPTLPSLAGYPYYMPNQ